MGIQKIWLMWRVTVAGLCVYLCIFLMYVQYLIDILLYFLDRSDGGGILYSQFWLR